ncbi:transcription elongation factor B polypeptide 3-like [Chironomus tepperi]|uniref:transcription elongation factor B polypeptide 3-like n=1 Tax=Chironomus tepperi TaxID=113505 RepID=UPI00391FC890
MDKYSRSVINEEEFLFVAPQAPRDKHQSKKSSTSDSYKKSKSSSSSSSSNHHSSSSKHHTDSVSSTSSSSSKSRHHDSEHKLKEHKRSHDSKSSSHKTSSSHKRSREEAESKDNEQSSKKMKSEHEKSDKKSKSSKDEKRSKSSSSSKEDKLTEKTESVKSSSSSKSSSSHKKDKNKEKSPSSPPTSIPVQNLTLCPDWLTQMPKSNLSSDIMAELSNTSSSDYQQASMNTATTAKPSMPKPVPSESELLTKSISSIKSRTRIFSGNARSQSEVPTLKSSCLRILTQNLDDFECIGAVPFNVIRPALEKAKPEQLTKIEYYNPYLLDESDILWKVICQRKWRTRQPTEMESWREMYERCNREDDEKLNRLTKNIRQGQEKSSSCVQRTKITFVDTTVKAPKRSQVVKKPAKKPAVMSLAVRIEALKSAKPNYVVPEKIQSKVATSVQVGSQHGVKRGPVQRTGSKKAAPMMAKLLSKFRR